MAVDPPLLALAVLGLLLLVAAVGVYAFLFRTRRIRKKSPFFLWGVALGLILCGLAGVGISAAGVYPDAAPLGVLYGFAVGAWIGIALELRHQT